MNDQRQSDQGERQAIILVPHEPSDTPEAFGTGRTIASDLEAFGNPNPKEKKTKKKDKGKEEEAKDSQDEEEDEKDLEDKDQEKQDDENGDDEENEDDEKDDAKTNKNNKEKDSKKNKKDDDKKLKQPPLYKRPIFLLLSFLILAVLILAGILYWLYARQYVSTDDAYIDGHVTQIAPQIAAPIKALHIDDNQFVHQGDLLIELDPTDYKVALDQANASAASAQGHLIQAQTQITVAEADIPQTLAQIDAAHVQLDNADADLKRYQNVDPRARSQQQLDNATAAYKNAKAQFEAATAKKIAADAQVESAKASVKAAQGDLEKAHADVEKAHTNLAYCRILAPSDGRITIRTIEPGAYVTPGQTLFSIVSPNIWVTANFKETQLTHMRPGQSVEITIDAYPDKKFRGHIDSIQAGSGARFSVLPAENATGNFVKIVQRIPVKILFDNLPDNTPDAHLLSPGLSVTPKVKVR